MMKRIRWSRWNNLNCNVRKQPIVGRLRGHPRTRDAADHPSVIKCGISLVLSRYRVWTHTLLDSKGATETV